MDMNNTKNMLLEAQKGGYAVPAFNVHNLETFKVVAETAQELNSPVIIAATPSTIEYSGLEYLYEIARVANEINDVEITFHLDHHNNIEDIKRAIKLGVKSVMIDASHHDFEENIRITKEVVDFANQFNVSVEAELGVLSGVEDELVIDSKDSSYTNPKLAAEFVKRTGVHSLAIAIGTAHGVYDTPPKLDIERLKLIRSEVEVPLVLHGASGIPINTVKKCVAEGICKVNIATELKMPFAKELIRFFSENPDESDPRKYFKDAKVAMAAVVREKIYMCGSDNRL